MPDRTPLLSIHLHLAPCYQPSEFLKRLFLPLLDTLARASAYERGESAALKAGNSQFKVIGTYRVGVSGAHHCTIGAIRFRLGQSKERMQKGY